MTINAPDDPHEREADRVAEKVVARQPAAVVTRVAGSAQAKCAECEEEEVAQAKGARSASATAVTRAVRNPGTGRPLPPATRGSIEQSTGYSMAHVRVHTGGDAVHATRAIGARAFTHGNHIWLGRGESASDTRLMAHEAAHVVQQGAAERIGATREPTGAAGTVLQLGLLDSITGAVGAVWDATGGRLVDAAGELIQMGAGLFWKLIRRVAGSVVSIIEEIIDKGIVGFIKDRLGRYFEALGSFIPGDGGLLSSAVEVFGSIVDRIAGILEALAAGDCEPLFSALETLKETATELAGNAWESITSFFAPVGDFFESLWNDFLAPFGDWIASAASDVWETIKEIGARLWDLTEPVRDILGAAWDWLKEQIGFGGGEGGEDGGSGGIIGWFKEVAGGIWDEFKEFLAPVVEPIKAFIAKIVDLLPLDAITDLRDSITSWLSDVSSMADSLNTEDGAARNQTSLREEILPAMLASITTLRARVTGAGLWISEKVGAVVQFALGMLESLGGVPVLGHLVGALGWLRDAITTIGGFAQNTVQGLFGLFDTGLSYVQRFAEPVLRALQKLFEVLGDIASRLPDLVLGPVWWVIPDCIKNPLKDFIVNQILKRIPIFGTLIEALPDIWAQLRDTALTILRQIFVDGDLAGAAWTFFSSLLGMLGLPADLVVAIIARGAEAIGDILSDPLGFVLNLIRAIGRGFGRFFDNIWTHLFGGVVNWLLGTLRRAGIQPPSDFSLRSVIGFVFDVLGLTFRNVLDRIRRKSPRVAQVLERGAAIAVGAWTWIQRLVEEGPGAIWEFVQEKLSELWDNVLDSVIGWITREVVEKVSARLLMMLDPSGIGAIIQTLVTVYKAIESFIEYLREMLEIVHSVVLGVSSIAKGILDQAAGYVESALANAIPVAIGFLANQAGLGGLSDKIREMVEAVRERVNDALDWLIDKALRLGSSILEGVRGVAGAARDTALGFLGLRQPVTFEGESHTLLFDEDSPHHTLSLRSTKRPLRAWLSAEEAKPGANTEALARIKEYAAEINTKKGGAESAAESEGSARMSPSVGAEISELFGKIAEEMSKIGTAVPPSRISFSGTRVFGNTEDGLQTVAKPLSIDSGGVAGSSPFESSDLWNEVRRRRHAYVRGHLLNHNLHGPGSMINMTPIPQDANKAHSTEFEEKLKKRVLVERQVISYTVTAKYTRSETRTNIPAEAFLAQTFHIRAYEMQPAAGATDRSDPSSWEETREIFDRDMSAFTLPPDTAADVQAQVRHVNLNDVPGPAKTAVRRHLIGISGIGARRAAILLREEGAPWTTWQSLMESANGSLFPQETIDKIRGAGVDLSGQTIYE